MRNWPPYMIPNARNWVVAAVEKSRILKSSMSISALIFSGARAGENAGRTNTENEDPDVPVSDNCSNP